MVLLRPTSSICARIVIAFLDFISSVKGTAGEEINRLENIKKSLKEIFELTLSEVSSSGGTTSPLSQLELDLFHEFYAGLAKYGYFEPISGEDYQNQKGKVKKVFKNAMMVMRNARSQTFNIENLADALNLKGNKTMYEAAYFRAILIYAAKYSGAD